MRWDYVYKLMVILLIVGCNSSKEIVTTPMSKDVAALITQKRYYVESDVAYPTTSVGLQSLANSRLMPIGSSVNRFDLIGNTNYFKVLGDSLSVNLPYFGEQQMGGLGYNNRNSGIKFEGIPEEYSEQLGKKGSKIINYTLKNGVEMYAVRIEIYPNGNCSMNINPSHRTSIRYRGSLKPIVEKEGVVSK